MYQGVPGCTRVYQGVPGCTRMYQGVPGCTGVYQGVPGCTRVYQGVPECTRVYQGVPGCTRVYWGCNGVYWENLRPFWFKYDPFCVRLPGWDVFRHPIHRIQSFFCLTCSYAVIHKCWNTWAYFSWLICLHYMSANAWCLVHVDFYQLLFPHFHIESMVDFIQWDIPVCKYVCSVCVCVCVCVCVSVCWHWVRVQGMRCSCVSFLYDLWRYLSKAVCFVLSYSLKFWPPLILVRGWMKMKGVQYCFLFFGVDQIQRGLKTPLKIIFTKRKLEKNFLEGCTKMKGS